MSVALAIVLITSGVILTLYALFKYSYLYFKKRNIPYLLPSFPFGNFKECITGKIAFGSFLSELYTKGADLPAVGVFQLFKPVLILKDPELIKQILVRDFSHFYNRGFHADQELDHMMGNLFFLEDTPWRNMRMKLSPTFTSGKMKFMFDKMKDSVDLLVKELQDLDGSDLEMKDLFARLFTDIIASCAFGIECNCIKNPDAEFRQWGRKIFEPSFKANFAFTVVSFFPSLQKFLKIRIFDKKVTEYFTQMVKDTIKYRETNNVKASDFMQLLIQLKNNQSIQDENFGKIETPNGIALNELQCAAQAFVFFLAGFETSSSAITHALYQMVKFPEVQKRIQEEVDQVLKKHHTLTYEAAQELVYLDRVIQESLRQNPPVPFLSRRVTKPVQMKCGGKDGTQTVTLEKDLHVMVPLISLHHDPKYFPDPEKFDPDRFLEENKAKRPQFSYLPFGEGPRNCIGSRFGLLNSKLALALLLHNYTFTSCAKTPKKLIEDPITLVRSFKEPFYFTISKRKRS